MLHSKRSKKIKPISHHKQKYINQLWVMTIGSWVNWTAPFTIALQVNFCPPHPGRMLCYCSFDKNLLSPGLSKYVGMLTDKENIYFCVNSSAHANGALRSLCHHACEHGPLSPISTFWYTCLKNLHLIPENYQLWTISKVSAQIQHSEWWREGSSFFIALNVTFSEYCRIINNKIVRRAPRTNMKKTATKCPISEYKIHNNIKEFSEVVIDLNISNMGKISMHILKLEECCCTHYFTA